MYKLTWILFALILPVVSAYVPAPQEFEELDMCTTRTGRGTWFNPGLGSCGGTNNPNDPIVALSESIMDGGSNCGKMVQISYQDKTVQAQVVDSCPGCGPDDVDMSPVIFQSLAPLDVGVITIQWDFV